MAEKRMFSKAITTSDAFLQMPLTAQALYFHLAMFADDEGFVGNPCTIRRMVGASEEDYKELLDKRYILDFKSGVVVIKHWWIHNVIKSDRFKKSTYTEELATLVLDEKKAYTERERKQFGTDPEPERSQTGTDPEPQNKLNQTKLNETNISPSNDGAAGEEKEPEQPPKPAKILSAKQERRFTAFWEHYPKKVGKQDAQRAWKRIDPDDELTDRILHAVEEAQAKDSRFREERYTPHPASWLNAGSWDDEFTAYVQSNGYQRDPDSSFDVDEFTSAAAERTRLP